MCHARSRCRACGPAKKSRCKAAPCAGPAWSGWLRHGSRPMPPATSTWVAMPRCPVRPMKGSTPWALSGPRRLSSLAPRARCLLPSPGGRCTPASPCCAMDTPKPMPRWCSNWPHPAVLVLNGSGGGINEARGALYASRGYTALALGYFKAPGLSDYISNTPLEYFETALHWMHRTLQPAHGFVALSGQSRGGELVLLLGSMFPDLVSAVIGYVPSAVVNCAQNACDPALGREGCAWLYQGRPIPHVWENNRHASWAPWDEGPEPRRHTHALLTSLRDAEAVERARIRVERIRGPVLLLSAGDDGSWPSSLYGRMVVEHLAQAQHPWPVQQLDWPGAGHSVVFPTVPTTQLVYAHPVSGRLSTTGGSPAANAQADQASWAGVLAFLQQAVAAQAAHAHP